MLRDTVRKFSEEVVAPRVRDMDEAEKMDPEVIKGLFDNGVSATHLRAFRPLYRSRSG
jgi:alkylation response protein AidB-like acyl-CoA dehydrogenase